MQWPPFLLACAATYVVGAVVLLRALELDLRRLTSIPGSRGSTRRA